MGKLTTALILTFVIEVSLFIFQGVSGTQTDLFNLLMNPGTFTGSLFYIAIGALFAIGLVAVIVPGTFIQYN